MSASTNPNNPNHYIVGVGASAGGLEALTNFVKPFPKDIQCSFVIIQHLSPNYRSMMVELIGRETQLKVLEAEDGTVPKAGTIYIAPPKWDLVMNNGRLTLMEPSGMIAPKPSANRFLYSLAEEFGDFAISVILSGTGSDGSAGSRAIKANGGITFAQDPDTAKYTGMPQSALNTGAIDHIMDPEAIAQEIITLVQTEPGARAEEPNETEGELFDRLFKMVRQESKIDFSGYKRSMLWRRIHRRMAANRIATFDGYVQFVEKNALELTNLSKDILISVTAFFRDPAVFQTLKSELTKLLAGKHPGEEIRIWIPGCATGEEAYTLGIVLYEILGADIQDYSVQIFATDIDLAALDSARQGIYQAASLDALDRSIIETYFLQNEHDFQVKKFIRDLIVFARQDVVIDPPFLRLDLVSCRNLLIYFDNDLQRKILHIVNYALCDHGLLLLGKSESVAQNSDLFKAVHTKHKLFTPAVHVQHNITARKRDFDDLPPRQVVARQVMSEPIESAFRELSDRYFSAPAVLLDHGFKLLMANGEIEHYVHVPHGKMQLHISQMLPAELSAEALGMLHSAHRQQKIVKGRRRRVRPAPHGLTQMIVIPGKNSQLGEIFLLGFAEVSAPRSKKDDGTKLSPRAMEDELVTTREHLQTLSEELETSNEELQALNEEVQASNEELQASNEELEASNEELQATNEELVTVNQELLVKSSELSAINADFSSVNNSFNFPVVVLDSNLLVSRVNKAAVHILGDRLTAPGTAFQGFAFDETALTLKEVNEVNDSGIKRVSAHRYKKRNYQIELTPCVDQLDQNRGVIITMMDQHDLVTAERSARDSRNFLMSIMDNSVLLTTVKDIAGRYEFANRAFLDRFDLDPESYKDKTDSSLLDTAVSRLFRRNDLKVIESLEPELIEEQFEWQGEELTFESLRFPLIGEDGLPYSICTQSRDITNLKQHRDELQLAATVIANAAEGIMVTDVNQNIISVNDSFSRITGYEEAEVLKRKPNFLSSGVHDKAFYHDMWHSIQQRGWWQGEITNRHKNGTLLSEWLTINEVRDDKQQLINYLGIFSDISVIKRSQERVEYLATHDDLTDLPNRILFTDRLKHALARAARNDTSITIMFCDLDNFKVINDTLGHETGDQLLIQAAQRLVQCVREEDTVARIGGDEFIILVEDSHDHEVETMALRILDALSASFHVANRDLYVSLSIGISQAPNDGEDAETLMKHADTAMYQSKENGKNQVSYFAEHMRLSSQHRLTIETGIRVALKEDGFHMLYQPVYATASDKIESLEALIRWDNKLLNITMPDQFIPVAEKSGLISLLDQWVIRNVMRQVRRWIDLGLEVPPVAINLSGQHFNSNALKECLEEQLELNDLSGAQFILEVTEQTLVSSISVSEGKLNDIVKLGFTIAIDDFGTGYSSLSYLQRMPIDVIKIDRSFIDQIHEGSDDYNISRAIINLAKSLGLDIIAEGVELEAQVKVLKELECPKCQGYYYSRPLTVDDTGKLLNKAPQ